MWGEENVNLPISRRNKSETFFCLNFELLKVDDFDKDFEYYQ